MPGAGELIFWLKCCSGQALNAVRNQPMAKWRCFGVISFAAGSFVVLNPLSLKIQQFNSSIILLSLLV